MSPTARTLAHLREDGWTVARAEHWNAYARRRVDLFGFADVVAVKRGEVGVLAVQATSSTNASKRVGKIEASAEAAVWLACGNRITVHGWGKRGPRGKRKAWTVRKIEIQGRLVDRRASVALVV
jgi:hypothetical protein